MILPENEKSYDINLPTATNGEELGVLAIQGLCGSLSSNLGSTLIRHVRMYESTETKSDRVAGEFARFLERATLRKSNE